MPDFSFQGIKDAIGSLLGQSAGEDAVSMLMADHKRVQEIFDTFKDLNDKEKIEAKHKALVELALHASVEEKLVYPLLREEDEDDEVNEAVVEHHVVKLLIVELEAMKQPNSMLDAKFKVLGEIVEHHVKEEESELFPKLRSSDNNLQELGAEIKALKEELLSRLGDEDDLEKIDPELSPHSTPNGHDREDHSNGKNSNRKSLTRARNTRATVRKSAAAKVGSAKTTSGRKQKPAAKTAGKASTTKALTSKSKKSAAKIAAKSSIPAGAKKVTKKSPGSKTATEAKPAKAKPAAKANRAGRAGASSRTAASTALKTSTKSSAKAKKPAATSRKAASTKKVAKKSK